MHGGVSDGESGEGKRNKNEPSCRRRGTTGGAVGRTDSGEGRREKKMEEKETRQGGEENKSGHKQKVAKRSQKQRFEIKESARHAKKDG